MTHNVTLIRGDGTGPELVAAAKRVLEATGVQFNWDVQEAGVDIMETRGLRFRRRCSSPFAETRWRSREPSQLPSGPDSAGKRRAAERAAALRLSPGPASTTPESAPSIRTWIWWWCGRTPRTSYAGVEYDVDTPEAKQIIEMSGGKIRQDAAISIKPISKTGTRDIVKFAFDYASKNGRKKVSAVAEPYHEVHGWALLPRSAEVAKDYPGIEYQEVLVDNVMQLVQKPNFYDACW